MAIEVFSEIGKLRRVLIHRPGREIDWMMPSMMEQLLFDDILYSDLARDEHDGFRRILEAAGAETLEAGTLLAEVLDDPAVRSALLLELERDHGVARAVVDHLGELAPADLASALVGGVRSPASQADRRRVVFDLQPLPNYFFQRDPQVVLGDRVVIASMATDARGREPLLARTLFRHHPALAGQAALFEIDVPPHGAPEHNPAYPYPTLEGGDVIVVAPDTLLVGLSERTNRRGAEVLAEYLRHEETSFRHLILVELPARRSYMHLDTVFTLIDRGVCLAYLPVIETGGAESAYAYHVDLSSRELAFAVRPSLLDALAGVGLALEVVPCGGADDLVDQQREQWTDGANAFAAAPGVILLYHRNRRTLDELARRGWRVISEADVLERGEPVTGQGPTVVALVGNELSRARGGPRCMTMPLEREAP